MTAPPAKQVSPVVEAKNRLVVAIQKETDGLRTNYDKLKASDEKKVKQYFAHELQLFCSFVDSSKSIFQTYFQKEMVPVSLIRAMEDYYATMKVMLSEFPDVAMDPKLQSAVSKVFLPYSAVISKMSQLADDYVAKKKAEAAQQGQQQ